MATGWFKRKAKKAVPPSPKDKSPGRAAPPGGEPAAATIPKGVSIGKLLTDELIVIRPPAAEKNQLMGALVSKLCAVKGLGDPAPFFRKVLEREQGISTTLDTGLSLPHARVEGIADIAVILGVLPQGIPDPKQPDLAIRAMFLFFSPSKQEAFTRHLHLLRSVSALFQPAFIEELLAAQAPAVVLDLIRKKEG